MKQTNYVLTALLALAGAALLAPAAHAQTTTFQQQSYYGGEDLYLVVTDTAEGAPHAYAVDLGSASQFANLAPGTTLDLGSFNADLATVFGAVSGGGTWQSSQAVWQVAGTNSNGVGAPALTRYVSAQVGSLSTYLANNTVSDWGRPSTTSQSIAGLASDAGTAGTDGQSLILTTAPVGGNYGISVDSAEAAIGDSNNDSQLPSSLDLIETPAKSSLAWAGTAQDLGTFTLDAQGDLTFTAAAAPEPTTWAMMLGGLGFLAWMLRRKQVLA